jgi:rubrerythrin
MRRIHMSLFNDITKKMGDAAKSVGDAAKSTVKKSEDMLEVSKLNREISSEQNKIEKIYLDLGKAAYNKYKATGKVDDELLEGCKQIDELENKIASIREKIEEIKDKDDNKEIEPQADELQHQEADKAVGQDAPKEEAGPAEGQGARKFCPNCGEKLTGVTKFCPSCGGKL